MYFLECPRFSAVVDHATLTRLLDQPSDELIDRQVHWVDRFMPFAQSLVILYCKGSVKEADSVSHRPVFFHPDDVQLRRPSEMCALQWDGKVIDMRYQKSDTMLLALSADIGFANDDFVTKFKAAYSSCP